MTFCLMPKNAANMIAVRLTKMGSHVLLATRLVVAATAKAAQMVAISTSAAAELTWAIFSMACLVAAGHAPAVVPDPAHNRRHGRKAQISRINIWYRSQTLQRLHRSA